MSCQKDVVTTNCRVNAASCQGDTVSKPVSCEHTAMSRRHPVKKHVLYKMVSCRNDVASTRCRINTVSCQNELALTRHRKKTTSSHHNVVPTRFRFKNDVAPKRRCFNFTSCQYDAVSRRRRAEPVSCQDAVLSETVSCEHDLLSVVLRRRLVKSVSRQEDTVSRRHRLNTTP